MQTHDSTSPTPTRTGDADLTHFVEYETVPLRRRGQALARAICGATVDYPREHSSEPTCPACRAQIDTFNELAF